MFEQVNELAVLVSAILAVACASIWYSPLLFGSIWLKSVHTSPLQGAVSTKDLILLTIKGIGAQVLSFLVMTELIALGVAAKINLFMISLLLLLFLFSQLVSLSVWEGRSSSYILVHLGYNALVLFGGMAIIVYWPW